MVNVGQWNGCFAVTNEQGYYLLEEVPAGERIVRAHKHGYLPAEATVEVIAESTVTVDFALESNVPPPPPEGDATLYGIVYDVETEEPIAGAHIVLIPGNVEFPPRQVFGRGEGEEPPHRPPCGLHAVSDEQGYYEITNIPEGEYTLIAMASRYELYTDSFEIIGEEEIEYDIGLTRRGEIPFGALEGFVTDADTGEPIGGAFVAVMAGPHVRNPHSFRGLPEGWGGRRPHGRFVTRTDENGYYSFENVPQGTWPMAVIAAGYQPAHAEVEIIEGELTVMDFALSPLQAPGLATLSGTVTDADSGESLAEAWVALLPPGFTPGQELRGGMGGFHGIRYTRTNEDGVYLLENVPAGQYTAVAWKQGYMPEFVQIELVAEEETVLDFTLEAAGYPSLR